MPESMSASPPLLTWIRDRLFVAASGLGTTMHNRFVKEVNGMHHKALTIHEALPSQGALA